ncbi:MAG: hypothetical protein ACD_13C00144G0018 [uncultured bacterium]|uniref:Uncharacterized protein n=1 Tax=Candidatus Woesebacteria bacterium GW2011_GWA1_40_43 TaxID=1618553 RepID=A0A0G0SC12_9BACT|nr:MAG: hypothetical protein ACD_13C00144G0018 [uncultured bacterium]KKR53903.1 MAG: hypothetical protein UT88_C0005G0011 [Candidatus Woesebacteria bacterium GW2011_GWD2_40_19]KKR58621.1 MAG: hypothetical protein UT96_C0002G0024 [Candidatus Woesebacteria bacterium GW2011_GWC2_40_30]KKR62498.1 MAG: hypothetical protein UU02_C0045G0008 [Candidatus Woesebacteria bacterium GW2011_GWA1_40_43]HAU65312.1 hypothetical protein [Candidatus Woesebacteria bacterium]
MHIKHIGKPKLIFMFLPVFILFTYALLFLETVKYPGFIGNHFLIDAKVYFAITIVFLIFSDAKSNFAGFVLRVNRLILIPLSLIYLGFSLLEGAHFTNYVLSTFKFHLDGLVLVVLFSLSIYLVDKFKNTIPRTFGKLGPIYAAMIFLITFFMVKNITYAANTGISRNSYILFHLRSSYDDKMFYEWGVFYRFMVFVKNNTPQDATIIIPPMEDPWLMGSGNDHFVRAFLYPRKLIQEPKIIPDIKAFGPNTYILITWGKEACKPDPECHGWPRQEIAAKRIIYKDPDSTNVIETRENSVYKLEDDKYVYGIIEL